MTAKQWDEWGVDVFFDANTGNWDNTVRFMRFPAFPACTVWEDDPESHCYMRLRGRVFFTTPDPVAHQSEFDFFFRYGCEGNYTTVQKQLGGPYTEEWSDEWETCLGYDYSYQTGAYNAKSSQGYKAETHMPNFFTQVAVVGCSNADETDVATVYGYHLGVQHSAAYTGRDLELFDYSGGSAYASQASASSVVVSLAGISAYNVLTYNATWMFSFAV